MYFIKSVQIAKIIKLLSVAEYFLGIELRRRQVKTYSENVPKWMIRR